MNKATYYSARAPVGLATALAAVVIGACGQSEPSKISGTQTTAENNRDASSKDQGPKKLEYHIQMFGGLEYSGRSVNWTVDADSPVGRRTKELFALFLDQKARPPAAVDTNKYKIASNHIIRQLETIDGKAKATDFIRLYMFAPSYTVEMSDRTFKLDDADMKAVKDYIRFVYGAYEKTKPPKAK